MMGTIHCADAYNERYLRVYNLLSAFGRVTTLALMKHCGDCAPHSTIAEMRSAGYPISKAIYVGKSNNRKVYAYELVA